jgi:putative transcriptional regulator
MGGRRGLCGGLIAVLLSLPLAAADGAFKGSLLVASRSNSDPELAGTVVLLLRSDAQGAIGIVVNQPTGVSVSTIFPRAGQMPVYKGGPLRMGINGLVRENAPTAGRSLVFGDVYLVSNKPDLDALVSGSPALPLRVYVGLCGWTAGQLAGELRRGVWSIHNPSAAIVFNPRPESIWRSLTK